MRWITLDGAVNVRDVGGMPTGDGSVTAERRLLRADNLQGLSSSDVSRLVEEFGLTRVIDLRSRAEVTAEGPGPLTAVPAIEHVHHSVIPVEGDKVISRQDSETVTEVLLARADRFNSENPDDIVCGHYLGYLQDRPDSVVAALRAIADSPGTALVHCAAGKDRTGVVVALALTSVGVRREAVVADYAATAERITAILNRLRASDTYAAGVNRITDEQHTPRASVMELFLDQVDLRHGGVLQWLADQGFDDEDHQSMKHKLLAGS